MRFCCSATAAWHPLGYKFAKYKEKIYSTYKTQLYCYACLIEENFGKKVKKGFLVYTRSNNKLVEIDISDTDKQEVKRCINEINKNLINNTLHFRKWFEKCQNKFFDILKTEILRISKMQLLYLYPVGYSD